MDQETNKSTLTVTDQWLATRAQAGSLDAFESLVRRYHAPLICFLSAYGVSSADAEDVAQEAFLKCYLHIQQFDPTRKFRNWLYTIARRSLPRVRKTALLGEEAERLCASDEEPPTTLLKADSRDSLWKTVRRVTSDEEFQLIWFRYAEQMSIGEAATILKQDPNACKMRLSRLRKRLKPHLQSFAGANGCGIRGFSQKAA